MQIVHPARLTCFTFFVFLHSCVVVAQQPVQFNRDIRPILSDKCFACHGPAANDVDVELRLDLQASATGIDGPIVPGDPAGSEFVRRILSTEEDEQMPPVETHKPLDASEIELLRRWIAEGANYEPHWAYKPLIRPSPPTNQPSTIGVIDQFINNRLQAEGIEAATAADRVTLIRRLSFDLTGMPPTIEEVDDFVTDDSPAAYEKLVDRLLRSPRFGERMAVYWLDLVRYADTVGYHGDQNISQSPYRDYVIRAFNNNMPFDRFVREQLAGDLLTDPSLDQRVASAYNRLNQTTEEGGSQAKEYLAIYFADRVRNVSQVFMGATMGCAQCHDHKFDPFSMRDFYAMGAFFADLQEKGVYAARSRPPMISVPTPEQTRRIASIGTSIDELRSRITTLRQQLLTKQAEWESSFQERLDSIQTIETSWVDDVQNSGGKNEGNWHFVAAKNGPVFSGKKSRRQQSAGLVQHFFIGATKKVPVAAETKFFAWIYLDPETPPKALMLQLHSGNWDHRAVWGSDDIQFGRRANDWSGYRRIGDLPGVGNWVRLEIDAEKIGIKPGQSVDGMAFTQFGGLAFWDKAGWQESDAPPNEVIQGLQIATSNRDASQASMIREYYLSTAQPIVELNNQIASLEADRKSIEESTTQTPISKSVSPRKIRILPRGNWMDDSGEEVSPAIPAFTGKLSIGDRRATRLDLADWLCQADNIFTSRTMANRLWYLMFGRGICSSVDDFGGQGTFPSHPELLDWLAVEFVESGWDIKHLVWTIVTSEAYKRSSKPTPRQLELDPYNELLARQGRFPLAAEMVRDGALAVSGLLVEKIGGVSARPYQPPDYYAQLNFPKRKYVADQGDNQYRRGLYTHWQRTFLHPMLKAFDAPSREECTAARARSNTPLQALTLLNDPTFVEAARVFAARIIREGGENVDERIAWAYKTVVSRPAEPTITTTLHALYQDHLTHYRGHLDDAKQLIATGNSPIEADVDAAELAAWTSVARVVLNLHETIMRY